MHTFLNILDMFAFLLTNTFLTCMKSRTILRLRIRNKRKLFTLNEPVIQTCVCVYLNVSYVLSVFECLHIQLFGDPLAQCNVISSLHVCRACSSCLKLMHGCLWSCLKFGKLSWVARRKIVKVNWNPGTSSRETIVAWVWMVRELALPNFALWGCCWGFIFGGKMHRHMT